MSAIETAACTPVVPNPSGFNSNCKLPYGLTIQAVKGAMESFCTFLGNINTMLHGNRMQRLECILMQANFSSVVGEFIKAGIPKFCGSLVQNGYHNGHPDLIPVGVYPKDAVQHGHQGIEVKGSRYRKAWQGHNAEDCWLMVVVFRAGRPTDFAKGVAPEPFAFVEILGAQLQQSDWKFAGRSATSRRTITASVQDSGYQKMTANWIYRDPKLVANTPVTTADLSEVQ